MKKELKLVNKFIRDCELEDSHTPQNLIISLYQEVSELAQNFLWASDPKQLPLDKKNVEEELMDIIQNCLSICRLYDIDPETAFKEKMAKNFIKYYK